MSSSDHTPPVPLGGQATNKESPGLEALFNADIDDSDDSDDESYEDQGSEPESDEDFNQGGGGSSSSIAVGDKYSGGAIQSGKSQLETAALVRQACREGNHEKLTELISPVPAPSFDNNGTTSTTVVPYNIDHLIHARDDWDVSPLHAAIMARSLKCVEVLLSRGVNIADRHEGFSYLHSAIAIGTLECNRAFSEACVDKLIAKDADLSIEDVQGFSPLHFAAFHGDHTAVAKIIAAARARSSDDDLEDDERSLLETLLQAPSHNGQTPLDVAKERRHAQVESILQTAKSSLKPGAAGSGDGVDTTASSGSNDVADATKSSSSTPKNKTMLFHSDECVRHASVDFKARNLEMPPENANRIKVLLDSRTGILRSSEFEEVLEWNNSTPEASISDILRVHEYVYVHRLDNLCRSLEDGEHHHLDADTLLNNRSFSAARRAAGTVIAAIDAVVKGGKRNAFCAVRPPGHHAGPYGQEVCDRGPEPFGSHGFCLLNNVAIGAAYARCVLRDLVQKVAILDFDVHHGNGTEACVRNLVPTIKEHAIGAPFLGQSSSVSVPSLRPWLSENDADHVFFASVHGYEEKPTSSGGYFYPGTGATESPGQICIGDIVPRQHIYNVGMRKHCRHDWRERWIHDILTPLVEFKPDLILLSAGFDAHCRDKLNHGYIGLVQDDYSWLTSKIVEVANKCCHGRVVSVLEGGYRIHGGIISPFARSVAAHVRALVTTPLSREWVRPSNPAAKTSITSNPGDEEISSAFVAESTKRKSDSADNGTARPSSATMADQYPGESQERKRSRRHRAPVNYVELQAKLEAEEKAVRASKAMQAAASAE